VLTVAIAILAVGATMIYLFERGSNPSIDSPGDAVWWAIVTATTVGYGDISPTTWGGRAVAVVLMFVGIGVIGLFTGNVAGFFIEQEANPPSDVEARLARIEAQLALLIERHGTTAAAVMAVTLPVTPGSTLNRRQRLMPPGASSSRAGICPLTCSESAGLS
jgi:voltage-gated potassium channel Kch